MRKKPRYISDMELTIKLINTIFKTIKQFVREEKKRKKKVRGSTVTGSFNTLFCPGLRKELEAMINKKQPPLPDHHS